MKQYIYGEIEAKEIQYRLHIQYTGEYERFNYTSAAIGNKLACVLGHYVIPIKSYNTIVAFVDVDTETVVECGKYSRTTSKQISQIANQRFRGFGRQLPFTEGVWL